MKKQNKKQTAKKKWLLENPDYHKNYNRLHKKENVENVLRWRQKNKPHYNEYMKNLQRKLRKQKKE